MPETLNRILQLIAQGETPDSQQLLPFLTVDSITERTSTYARIALACLKANTPENLKIGREFIQRAWLQSGFDERLLPLYEKIHDEFDDIEAIREAYKRLGINKASQGNFKETLRYFDLWQNAYGNFRHLDKFSYDFDILNCMERLAAPHRAETHQPEPLNGRKIRLAYLMRGILDVNSALVRLDLNFARYHDKSRFEIVYFVLENQTAVTNSPHATETIRSLRDFGCLVVPSPDTDDLLQKLLSLNQLICEYHPDIFITSAALADFGNCFVTMLRPAPLSIAFASGPPPQFVIPNCHDWSIGWIKHTLMDSPVGTNRLRPHPEIADRTRIMAASRNDFDIPESACLLISTGRTQKFQEPVFWLSVSRILEKYDNCYFMVVGVTEEYIACLDKAFPQHLRTRARFVAWHANYLSLLAISDIALDTYPSGGGGTLFDAMALGIPIVSFRNDYLHQFDQTDWSVAEEVLTVNELIAPRGDMQAFESIVGRLIEDVPHRRELGEKCAAQVVIKGTQNEQVVRELEDIYINALTKKQHESQAKASDPLDSFPIEWLRYENFQAWQKAYRSGYNSDMGEHWNYSYNQQLIEIDLYNLLEDCRNFVEFAPGKGDFIAAVASRYPNKKCYAFEISESNYNSLNQRFCETQNIQIYINDQQHLPINNIDLVFSFLLCQSMPTTLWREHLHEVHRILSPGGVYIFQFAYHSNNQANDSIAHGISGSQVYQPDEIGKLLSYCNFKSYQISSSIDLAEFNTETVWFIAKATK